MPSTARPTCVPATCADPSGTTFPSNRRGGTARCGWRCRGASTSRTHSRRWGWWRHSGLDVHHASMALETTTGVPGRMEGIDAGQPFTVIVDYAHTADALHKMLATLRPVTKGRLIVVFGSAGERARRSARRWAASQPNPPTSSSSPTRTRGSRTRARSTGDRLGEAERPARSRASGCG